MEKLNYWNCKKHEYEIYFVPNDWYVTMGETNMNKVINCADCGKTIRYGDSYTSKLIHNDLGIGYCVCSECQTKEWKEYLKHKGVND